MIPKSGNWFSDKIMLKTENLDRDPIQLNWVTVGVGRRSTKYRASREVAGHEIVEGLYLGGELPRCRIDCVNRCARQLIVGQDLHEAAGGHIVAEKIDRPVCNAKRAQCGRAKHVAVARD